jgi:HSP20 family protein
MATLSKRLLITLGMVPLLLGAATTPPKSPSEKPCGHECPFWGMQNWDEFFNRPLPHMAPTYASTMKETEKAYLISIDLPGMDKKDIRIETVGNRLNVSGERKDESETKEGSKHSFAEFRQSYLLPDDADLSAIEATSKNGVLKITVPRSPSKSKARKIDIR